MLKAVMVKQLEKRELLVSGLTLAFIAGIYVWFDVMAFGSYAGMRTALSGPAFASHIFINFLLALTTATMISAARMHLKVAGFEPRGATAVPVFSFVFALFTFACTPCVIAFFAALGLAFTPLVLPAGNLLWKVVLLALLTAFLFYYLVRISKGVCRIKKR